LVSAAPTDRATWLGPCVRTRIEPVVSRPGGSGSRWCVDAPPTRAFTMTTRRPGRRWPPRADRRARPRCAPS
jgi:hypothetical protein